MVNGPARRDHGRMFSVPDIRPATGGDAAAIAAVHATAWRETYAALLPAPLRDGPPEAERARRWLRLLAASDGRLTEVFAVRQDSAIVGFCAIAPQRAAPLAAQEWAGEVTALYLLGHAQRKGLGRMLLATAAHRMLDCGVSRASVWVLSANQPARRFYEATGGTAIAGRREMRAEGGLDETAYGWEDLERLL